MNRGRRRGGPGLSGLKDGVKRRLFDPHLVPTKPDPKYEINRLIPLATCKPFIRSYLDDLRCPEASVFPPASEDPSDSSDKLYNSLFKTKAIFELAFRNGPFYHPLPVLRDGIDTALVFGGLTSNEKATEPTAPVLLSHLLLAHDDINQWSNGEFLSDLDNMDSFYPKDLVQFTKPGRRPAARMRERLKRRAKMAVPDIPIAVPDLDDLVPDLPPQQDAEVVEEKD
ncbi:unnamed protein product, partial [Dicrocoelium dendriticum]